MLTGLKRLQEDSNAQELYKLVDLHGGGELLPWVKYAKNSGDSSMLDGILDSKVLKYMYNNGKGRVMPIAELVKIRNKERNALLGALRRKKGKGKSGPNILEDLNQDENQGDLKKALKLLDGGGKGGKGGSKYREIVWDIHQRGAMGENLLHVCLLQGTAVHNALAIKLIQTFPKLVNDIFLSEDYYGQSPLHQAIVNEDPRMVLFLLQNDADIHQRCYGAFFCPEDQKTTRTDSLEHEWADVSPKTNYQGRMYYGEYPLCFAACLNQPDCVRLLRARKADPNMRDTNGNTVLHLMVIHELPEIFDLLHRLGAKLQVQNNQNLTPLTLAAKMAKKKMFDHVLTIERDVLWTYGDVVCAAYPLAKIDSIDQTSGRLNKDSALALIVYEESNAHLDLLDGLMEDLLREKWKAFARKLLRDQFLAFLVYFGLFFGAFIYRPYDQDSQIRKGNGAVTEAKCAVSQRQTGEQLVTTMGPWDGLGLGSNSTSWDDNSTILAQIPFIGYKYIWFGNDKDGSCHMFRLYFTQNCYDWGYSDPDFQRLCCEGLCFMGMLMMVAVYYIQVKRTGARRYWQTLMEFPAKLIFILSFVVIFLMGIARICCSFGTVFVQIEHILAMLAMLATSLHFLFFCRGIQFVGPFVLMVYKIIAGDMLRFFLIYLIFVIGFSQSFFVLFLGCNRRAVVPLMKLSNTSVSSDVNGTDLFDDAITTTISTAVDESTAWMYDPHKINILSNAFEAFLRMFIMSIGEFAVFYKELNSCQSPLKWIGKVLFLFYELVVSILLINLLIAMMGRTYNRISETEKEWKRQWARVILMMEQSLTPKARLMALLKYSRPIGTNKTTRAFVVKWKQTMDETKTEKEKREERWKQFREEKRAHYKRRQMDAGGLETGSKSRRMSALDENDGAKKMSTADQDVL